MVRKRRSTAGGWAPVIVGAVLLALVLGGVAALVSAQQPTVARADDVAVFSPPLTGRQTDVIQGDLRREAGCTYLDADDGRRWLVMFPDLGTRWDQESLWVDQDRFLLDRSVDLRGDIVKLPVGGFDTVIPDGCRETSFVFMVEI